MVIDKVGDNILVQTANEGGGGAMEKWECFFCFNIILMFTSFLHSVPFNLFCLVEINAIWWYIKVYFYTDMMQESCRWML